MITIYEQVERLHQFLKLIEGIYEAPTSIEIDEYVAIYFGDESYKLKIGLNGKNIWCTNWRWTISERGDYRFDGTTLPSEIEEVLEEVKL